MGTQNVNDDAIEMIRLLELGARVFDVPGPSDLDLHRAGFTAAEINSRREGRTDENRC